MLLINKTKKKWRPTMKRKIMTGIASIAFAWTFAIPIHAEDMSVSYAKETTYTLTIPNKITLSSTSATNTSDSGKIGVKEVNTTPDQKVQIKIQSGITDGKIELTRTEDAATKVSSDITDKDNQIVTNNTVIAEFQGTSINPIIEGTGVFNFSAITDTKGDIVKAGNYTGTLVFEASVVKR